MDQALERQYVEMAQNHPDLLCSQVPTGVLEAASSVDEPTEFLKEFFAAGYLQWLSEKYGYRVQIAKESLDNAIVVLWLRACRLHTSRMLNHPSSEWDNPFFSDDSLHL